MVAKLFSDRVEKCDQVENGWEFVVEDIEERFTKAFFFIKKLKKYFFLFTQ